jgi:hypothetical protein
VHNQNPKPFLWTAKANDIPPKVTHANRTLGSKKNEALQIDNYLSIEVNDIYLCDILQRSLLTLMQLDPYLERGLTQISG